jgi:glutaredoxin-related protein
MGIKGVLLHPAKRATFLERLLRKPEENEIKFSKKNFKKFLPVRNRSCSFAPASRGTPCESNETKKQEDTFLDILN